MPFLLLLLLFPLLSAAQNSNSSASKSSYLILRNIYIEGNKQTKPQIILREINFAPGDTIYPSRDSILILRNRNRVFNTGLFVFVELSFSAGDSVYKDLYIKLKERWYLYPVPTIELGDRNFNEWWEQRGHSLNRLIYGVNIVKKNMRGRNETLKIKLQTVFTDKAEVSYFIPYLNKKRKLGLSAIVSYSANKRVAYDVYDDKLAYTDNGSFLRQRMYAAFAFSYRRRYYQSHFFGGGFYYNTIGDTIAALNPEYYLNGKTSQRYFALRYSFVNDFRDIAYYPLKGYYLRFDAEKLGLGIFNEINILNLKGEYARFWNLGHKFYAAMDLRQKISFPQKQPFANYIALGYLNDYVSGYELYVINGQDFSLGKLNVKYRLLSKVRTINKIPLNHFRTIPYSLYLRAYSDAGYVVNNYSRQDPINLYNTLLVGGGMGLDLVTYYDMVIRVEYSVNRLLQTGVYLHLKAPI